MSRRDRDAGRAPAPAAPADGVVSRRAFAAGVASLAGVDADFRGRSYREMVQIFLEHLPWIPLLQPVEWYGVQKHVDWHAYPNQQLEIRRFNLSLRRP